MRVTCCRRERRIGISVGVAAHEVNAPGGGGGWRNEQVQMLAAQELIDARLARKTLRIGERRSVVRILESRRLVRPGEDILAEELQLVRRVSIEGDELLEGTRFDGARRP